MKMIQIDFLQNGGDQYGMWTNHKLVWIDASWKLKEGDIVTFKDEEEKWAVSHVYETIIESADLDKKWGLDLPRGQRTER